MRSNTRIGIIVYICSAAVIVLVVLGLVVLKITQKPEPEIIKTQEEYQMELLEMLDKISLLVPINYDGNSLRLEIAPGVELFFDRLATQQYCYALFGKTESVATLEDIANLYASYNEELEDKFLLLYYWLKLENGKSFYESYCMATNKAYALYEKQYGAISGANTMLTTEQRIMLEQFARDNPDFMPGEVYYKELSDMCIISGDEYYAFKEAAQK